MNLRDLQYLVALAKHRHFGKAAQCSFVTQPTLSMQIKRLEEELGVQLLERTNKSVHLTTIGSAVAEQAQEILQKTKDIYEMVQFAKNPYQGELHCGIIPTLSPYLLPKIMPSLINRFANIKFYLTEEKTHKLLKMLKEGDLDVAILALPIEESYIVQKPIFLEEFMLAVPAEHHLARKKNVTEQELVHESILLLEEGHCLRDQALALCKKINAQESSQFRATSLETLRHMVLSGLGLTLMPKLACRSNDGLSYLPFIKDKPLRQVGMIWRVTSAKAPLLEELAMHLQGLKLV